MKTSYGSFKSMNLNRKLLRNIKHTVTTPIQRKIIPFIQQNSNITGIARTGSGKTFAYLVPLLDNILKMKETINKESFKPNLIENSESASLLSTFTDLTKPSLFQKDTLNFYILVLVPTRELSLQVGKCVTQLSYKTSLSNIIIHGGTSIFRDFNKLIVDFSSKKQKTCTIVDETISVTKDVCVSTIGRLLHILRETNKKLCCRYLVIDELDRIFDEKSMCSDLFELIGDCYNENGLIKFENIFMFSATLPEKSVELVNRTKLVQIDCGVSRNLSFNFFYVSQDFKEKAVVAILDQLKENSKKAAEDSKNSIQKCKGDSKADSRNIIENIIQNLNRDSKNKENESVENCKGDSRDKSLDILGNIIENSKNDSKKKENEHFKNSKRDSKEKSLDILKNLNCDAQNKENVEKCLGDSKDKSLDILENIVENSKNDSKKKENESVENSKGDYKDKSLDILENLNCDSKSKEKKKVEDCKANPVDKSVDILGNIKDHTKNKSNKFFSVKNGLESPQNKLAENVHLQKRVKQMSKEKTLGKLNPISQKIIVFCATKHTCLHLSSLLTEYPHEVLFSTMDQVARTMSLSGFEKKSNLLIVTDLASRGIDIRNIDICINYDLCDEKTFIHRIGRVARKGQFGQIFSLVCKSDLNVYACIKNLLIEKLSENEGHFVNEDFNENLMDEFDSNIESENIKDEGNIEKKGADFIFGIPKVDGIEQNNLSKDFGSETKINVIDTNLNNIEVSVNDITLKNSIPVVLNNISTNINNSVLVSTDSKNSDKKLQDISEDINKRDSMFAKSGTKLQDINETVLASTNTNKSGTKLQDINKSVLASTNTNNCGLITNNTLTDSFKDDSNDLFIENNVKIQFDSVSNNHDMQTHCFDNYARISSSMINNIESHFSDSKYLQKDNKQNHNHKICLTKIPQPILDSKTLQIDTNLQTISINSNKKWRAFFKKQENTKLNENIEKLFESAFFDYKKDQKKSLLLSKIKDFKNENAKPLLNTKYKEYQSRNKKLDNKGVHLIEDIKKMDYSKNTDKKHVDIKKGNTKDQFYIPYRINESKFMEVVKDDEDEHIKANKKKGVFNKWMKKKKIAQGTNQNYKNNEKIQQTHKK